MHIFLRNFKFFIFLFTLFLNFNSYLDAHMRGTFLSEEDAENRSLELGCKGIHKNKDKWDSRSRNATWLSRDGNAFS